ncbi:MAG: ATP-grasp domain-containing protein [Sandaracinaceae bacterium]|nr:ATP-grasp domain-containing protein [Sandaracinaceae bacterium]
MIARALVQELGQGRLTPEMRDLAAALSRRGIAVELFHAKRLQRRQLALGTGTLVCGDIPTVESALSQLGAVVPDPHDYPEELHPYLRRRVWRSTVGRVLADACDGVVRPFFVKPAARLKRFTGLVIESSADAAALHGVSRAMPVWCAERVRFVSEHRVFVVRGAIVGVRPYEGDAPIDLDVVRGAIALYEPGAPRGYGIDFGVLDDGATALVEVNDGYGLGSYGLDPDVYAELVVARWEELQASPP